jgi:hypothetical protein
VRTALDAPALRQLQLPTRHVLGRAPWFSDYVLLDDDDAVRMAPLSGTPWAQHLAWAAQAVRDRFATLLATPLASLAELSCRERVPPPLKAPAPTPAAPALPAAMRTDTPAAKRAGTPKTAAVALLPWWLLPVVGTVLVAVLAAVLARLG